MFMKKKNLVISELQKMFGPDFVIKLEKIKKDNNVIKIGYVIKQKDSKIAPIFYDENFDIDDPYEKALCIYQAYYQNNSNQSVDINLNQLTHYNLIKDKIYCMILNKELNQSNLDNYPYIEFMDFVVLFYIDFNINDYKGKIKINHSLLEMWDISIDTLFEIAKDNTKQNLSIKKMSSVLSDMLDVTENDIDLLSMYIYTTKNNYYGAAAILFIDEIDRLANYLQSDLYILPSSVHELILHPVSNRENELDYINHMIKEINVVSVISEEVLSNHVYLYKKDEKKIIIP